MSFEKMILFAITWMKSTTAIHPSSSFEKNSEKWALSQAEFNATVHNGTFDVEVSLLWFSDQLEACYIDSKFIALNFKCQEEKLTNALRTIEVFGEEYIQKNEYLLTRFYFLEDMLSILKASASMILNYDSTHDEAQILLRKMIDINIRLLFINLDMHTSGKHRVVTSEFLRWCWYDMLRCRYEFERIFNVDKGIQQHFNSQRLQAEVINKYLQHLIKKEKEKKPLCNS